MHSDMWMQPEIDPRATLDVLKKKYDHVTGPFHAQPRGQQLEERFRDAFKIRYDEVVFGNTLFKASGVGKFTEVSDAAGVETFWPWGIATGDFDNDGFEDVFLPSGMGYPYSYWPSVLLMNNGNGSFTDRASRAGIDPPPDGVHTGETLAGKAVARSSRCAATADFTGSGRLDVVINNFNNRAYYFRNHFAPKNYVAFRLTGTSSNRDAIGAVVKLVVGKEVMVRQVHPAGGYLSQSSKTVHFGLGSRGHIDRVEIRWPGGKRQVIEGPAINRTHQVMEP